MTRKPKATERAVLQTDAIHRRLQYHGRGCAWFRYSDRENRRCSCGRDLAIIQLQALEEAAHAEKNL